MSTTPPSVFPHPVVVTRGLLLLALAALVAACGDEPDQGVDPTIQTVIIEAGERCPYGGTEVRTGFDANGDGQLTGAEVRDTRILCNDFSGGDADTGHGNMANDADTDIGSSSGDTDTGSSDGDSDAEPGDAEPGDAEPDDAEPGDTGTEDDDTADSGPGDTEQDTGDTEQDTGDDVIDPVEHGEFLFDSRAEAPGDDCPQGGAWVVAGFDANDNGTLDEGEIIDETLVCFDSPEMAVRVFFADQTTGCTAGGIVIRRGPDLNGNGILDPEEEEEEEIRCNVRYTQAALGLSHTCAIARGGSVWCWGRNADGQLCNGSTNDSAVPVQVVGITDARDIASSERTTCVVQGDGELWCWGALSYGVLGADASGLAYPAASPVPVQNYKFHDTLQVTMGTNHLCAVENNIHNFVSCAGRNDQGQIGSGNLVNNLIAFPSGVRWSAGMCGGSTHSCSLDHYSTVHCWGGNGFSQSGFARDDGLLFLDPVVVPNLAGDLTTIACGLRHTCVTNGDGDLFCWGSNNVGQLGVGTEDYSRLPNQIVVLSDVVQVSGGNNSTCAVDDAGDVWCWGSNQDGQLGTGWGEKVSSPQRLGGIAGAVQVQAGHGNHGCAVLDTGQIQCWGNNAYGQLGDSTTINRGTPVAVVGTLSD